MMLTTILLSHLFSFTQMTTDTENNITYTIVKRTFLIPHMYKLLLTNLKFVPRFSLQLRDKTDIPLRIGSFRILKSKK